MSIDFLVVEGAAEHNLKNIDVRIARGKITVVTGVSGSGKSSLVFDTVLAEAQRRFFYTLSHYSRQFLDIGSRPAVRRISGLSPSIALAQNETMPSRLATVGTLTDAAELLAVCFARFGEQRCPDHDAPTGALSTSEVADRILQEQGGETLAICAPIAEEKKGAFKAQLEGLAERGFLRVWVDGAVVPLVPRPELAREEKHTIKLIVDVLKIKPGGRERLVRSIETALKEGQGFGEYLCAPTTSDLDLKKGGRFSGRGGCPQCGFTWPRMDARHFSANSLGRCKDCGGMGILAPEDSRQTDDDPAEEDSQPALVCAGCSGTGVDRALGAIRFGGHPIQSLLALPLRQLCGIFSVISTGQRGVNPALERVVTELLTTIKRVDEVGLGYLHLARRIRSLSGGELQRLKLAGILTESLRGVLYILDEPSQGLHPREIELLWRQLIGLRDQGNTLIIVDHDEAMMRNADTIIDLGPGGGNEGGRLVAMFAPGNASAFAGISSTARWLAAEKKKRAPRFRMDGSNPAQETGARLAGGAITIRGASVNNLKIPEVSFPLGAMTVVTGVSGAGKSSLVLKTLYSNIARSVGLTQKKPGGNASSAKSRTRSPHIGCESFTGWESLVAVELIDRRPVAKNSVSMPASYLDVFTDIRELFAQLPEAQVAGLTPRSFSLNADGGAVGGRCETCKGRGEVNLTMRFLADARVRCEVCRGRRYRKSVEAIKFKNASIADVLEMTIDQALDHFSHHRRICQRLRPAADLGLGYLKLGQSSASLSGGESQRLKIVPYLGRRHGDGNLLILDEPTTGLHFEDVEKLFSCLRAIVESGATVVLIEHNLDVILTADWMLELGPGAAEAGGALIYSGPPEGASKAPASVLGAYMRNQ